MKEKGTILKRYYIGSTVIGLGLGLAGSQLIGLISKDKDKVYTITLLGASLVVFSALVIMPSKEDINSLQS